MYFAKIEATFSKELRGGFTSQKSKRRFQTGTLPYRCLSKFGRAVIVAFNNSVAPGGAGLQNYLAFGLSNGSECLRIYFQAAH